MSTSKIDSNMQGKNGTETITNFASVSGDNVKATDYVQISTGKIIFGGSLNKEASIVAAATALIGATVKGSIYSGRDDLWYLTSDTSASVCEMS